MAADKEVRLCRGTKKDGTQCGAGVMMDEAFCWFHHPDRAQLRKQASKRGGRASSRLLGPDADEFMVHSAEDVVGLLSELISEVARKAMDPKIASVIGSLAGVLLKALEQSGVEKRRDGEQPDKGPKEDRVAELRLKLTRIAERHIAAQNPSKN